MASSFKGSMITAYGMLALSKGDTMEQVNAVSKRLRRLTVEGVRARIKEIKAERGWEKPVWGADLDDAHRKLLDYDVDVYGRKVNNLLIRDVFGLFASKNWKDPIRQSVLVEAVENAIGREEMVRLGLAREDLARFVAHCIIFHVGGAEVSMSAGVIRAESLGYYALIGA